MKKSNALYFSALILLLTIVFFEYSDVDIRVQDYLYDFQSQKWLLSSDDKLLKLILYDGVKSLIVVLVLVSLLASAVFIKSAYVQNNKQGIVIVLLSAILIPSAVGALKAITNMPCPRDLSHYSGTYPHVSLLTSYPKSFPQAKNIRCYPAGHASGGFALMSLVFFFKKKKQKVIAGVATLTLGWLMGGYKMLIGDHFFSHTVVTMLLAWLIILMLAKAVYRYLGWPEKAV